MKNFCKEKIIENPFKSLLFIFIVIYLLSLFIILFFELKSELSSSVKVVSETIHQESSNLTEVFKELGSYGMFRKSDIKYKINNLILHNFSLVVVYNVKLKQKLLIEKTANLYLTNYLNKLHKKFVKNKLKKMVDFKIYKKNIYIFLIEKVKNDYLIEAAYKIPESVKNQIKSKAIQNIWIIFIVLSMTFIVIFIIINSFIKTIKNFNQYLIHENIMNLETIGSMIAKRDSDTAEHNYRVTYYALKIAENFPYKINIQALIKGAFLHDIGKIAIPDNILLKPAKLSEEEFKIMKTHVLHGYEIIKNNDFLKDATDVVLYHHEKCDGSGYIKGLKGEEIPINARIFAVADVFDALTSKRPYKEPFSFEASMKIIKEEKGKHFCPIVIDVFEKIAENLYNDIKSSSTEELKELIIKMIKKYFVDI